MRLLGASRALAGLSTIVLVVGLGVRPAAAANEVVLEKSVNGNPADQSPGPTVTTGTVVNFVYTVTVNSSEALYDIRVSDTSTVTPNCDINGDGKPDGFDFHPGPLQGGTSFVCTASETAGDPGLTYASLGKVLAIDFIGTKTFEHQDPAHYTTVAPSTTSPPTTKPPATAAPTTQAPTTKAPTTAAPTTKAPTTKAPTTVAPTTKAPTSAATESTDQATSSSEAATTERPTTSGRQATVEPETSAPQSTQPADGGDDDPDDSPPGELAAAAAADDDTESGRGLPPWLLLATFAAGAGLAFLGMKFGPGRDSVPDQ